MQFCVFPFVVLLCLFSSVATDDEVAEPTEPTEVTEEPEVTEAVEVTEASEVTEVTEVTEETEVVTEDPHEIDGLTGFDLDRHIQVIQTVKPPVRRFVFRSVFSIPKRKDWRNDTACINPARLQACSNCWAFAGVAALEAHLCIRSGDWTTPPPIISEQMYTDCVKTANGCIGGLPLDVFTYTKKEGRCDAAVDYGPNVNATNECPTQAKSTSPVVKVKGYRLVTKTMQAVLEAVANVGPVVVATCINHEFNTYKKAKGEDKIKVFVRKEPFECKANHALLLVGYNEEALIMKNSWGPRWGYDGYIYMDRFETAQNYGIYNFPHYPEVS